VGRQTTTTPTGALPSGTDTSCAARHGNGQGNPTTPPPLRPPRSGRAKPSRQHCKHAPGRAENQQKGRTDGRGVGVNASRRNWRLVSGVVVMLVALIVVGRLQDQNLGAGDAGAPQATRATVGTDDPLPVLWSYCCRRGDEMMGVWQCRCPHAACSPAAVGHRHREPTPAGRGAGRRHRRGLDPAARGRAAVAGAVGGRPGPRPAGGRLPARAGRGRRCSLGAVGYRRPRQRARSDRPAAAPGPAHRRGHRHHAAPRSERKPGGWAGPRRRAVWLGGPYAWVARWRHPAAGRACPRGGSRLASRPALVLPG
jgi:hypothetical protein